MEDVISADKVLAGVRVLEVAAWTFVRLPELCSQSGGAEVIKVEPRDGGGDPQRGGLVTMASSTRRGSCELHDRDTQPGQEVDRG